MNTPSKCIAAICLMMCFSASLFAQHYLNNTSTVMKINSVEKLVVNASIINKSNGSFDNAGTIILKGDWTNNSANTGFINSSPGTLILSGDTQNIKGSFSTNFFNLTLAGTGIKKTLINTNVEGVLDLGSRE